MYASAATVSEDKDPEPTKQPYHFDLAGLAQGLHKTASVAAHITKLKQHVKDAEAALKTHQGHVDDIKSLL